MAPSVEAIIKQYDWSPEGIEKVSARKIPNNIEIVEPDPTWPDRYALLKARIEAALPPSTLLHIAHAGSTSVPGLPAKDVVDIDVEVADPADEAAYVPALEAAGWHFRAREPRWHQHRFFSSYPPLAANLHVFGPDCPEVARHRVFRDWLAKSPEDRALYVAAKRRAAEDAVKAGERLEAYNLRKEPVIREILQRAFRDAGYIQ
ncbi:GrpB domain-containingprotein [Purpureocillium lavendulum]|uniref:GrpB domain-containingprotein n=1 Tax=Purpureocillium lavendulum TaxID=1247861 RepID=A0AB34FLL8_9HYPO|nr:GrpB domain-containingprotein [Purpureocillium lavendulum]